jgi:hypothetical protein
VARGALPVNKRRDTFPESQPTDRYQTKSFFVTALQQYANSDVVFISSVVLYQ